MNFSRLFKDIRRKENLTQIQFSEKLKVSRSAIAQIESSKNNPSRDLTLNILDKFDLPIEIKQQLKEHAGIEDDGSIKLKGVLFNRDELDTNKKEAHEMWVKIGQNKEVLLSLCFSLKEIYDIKPTDKELEELKKTEEVFQYLLKILIPYESSKYVNIDDKFLIKTNNALEKSYRLINYYNFKLSSLYSNKVRFFDDVIEYKDYKELSEDFPL